MRKVTCQDCGKHYDYDVDDFCPKCGSFNPPPDGGATRLEQELLSRFQHGPAKRSAPSARRREEPAAPARKSRSVPLSGTPDLRPARRKKGGPKALAVALVLVLVLAVVPPVVSFVVETAEDFVDSFSYTQPAYEPDYEPAPEPDALSTPVQGEVYHEVYEDFSFCGFTAAVGDPWICWLPDEVMQAHPGQLCLVAALWVEGGYPREDLDFYYPYLALDNGETYFAEDDPELVAAAAEYDIEVVTPYDAQWTDSLDGYMLFFVPEEAAGQSARLVLPEAFPGEEEPSAFHILSASLPESDY